MQLGKNSIAFEEMPLTLKRILKKVTTIIKPHQKPANWKCNAPRFCGYASRKQQGKTKIGVVEKKVLKVGTNPDFRSKVKGVIVIKIVL